MPILESIKVALLVELLLHIGTLNPNPLNFAFAKLLLWQDHQTPNETNG